MATQLQNSIFGRLLSQSRSKSSHAVEQVLGGQFGSQFGASTPLETLDVVVIDFETTGLNSTARIIELGAIKYRKGKEIAKYIQLIHPGVEISEEIEKITGITKNDLEGMPPIRDHLERFHSFLQGCLLVAHNAAFDLARLQYESSLLGMSCQYTTACTLLMSRALLKLEANNLDTIAMKHGFVFESRHRAEGDIKVTWQLFQMLLDKNPELRCVKDLTPYLIEAHAG